jgi:hypothetical protein
MSDMNVRSDSVDVEQIMKQIRARIREKRGVDYTEEEIQQLATAKLERFLDPRGIRSDLAEQYRRHRVVSPSPPNFEFGATTLYDTHRGILRAIRKLLKPLLKLAFNPDKITSALHVQAEVNAQGETRLRRLEEREPLHYELVHNLTLEVTRLGVEVQNLRMRVESLSSRVDFDERRARSLERVVQYAPDALESPETGRQPARSGERAGGGGDSSEGAERRRRRRRRRRRPGQTMAESQQTAAEATTTASGGDAGEPRETPQPPADAGPDSTDP